MARKLFAKKLKHGESRARRGAVGDCSRTFGACATQPIDSRFLLLYNSSFPDPQPALPQNYSLDRYFYRSSATRASPLETPPIFVSQKSNHSFEKKNHKSILGKSIGISNFVSLPKIPKTSNFKIDRKRVAKHFYLFFLSNAIENYWSTNSRLLPFFFFEERVSPWIDKIARSCRLGPPEDGPRSMRGGRVLWGGGEKETERQLSRFQNRRVARARHSLGGHPCDLPEVHR